MEEPLLSSSVALQQVERVEQMRCTSYIWRAQRPYSADLMRTLYEENLHYILRTEACREDAAGARSGRRENDKG
jgi:hypothetical protein